MSIFYCNQCDRWIDGDNTVDHYEDYCSLCDIGIHSVVPAYHKYGKVFCSQSCKAEWEEKFDA